MTITTLRRRLADAYGITPGNTRPYWAFYSDGNTLHAWKYLDGTFLANRASLSSSSVDLQQATPVIIHLDPQETVAPASLAWRASDGGRILVWDVEGSRLHQYASDRQLSHPIFDGTRLYWVENPPSTPIAAAHFELWSSPCDLSEPELEASIDFFQISVDWAEGGGSILIAGNTLLARRAWIDNINFEAAGFDTVHFPLPSGTPTHTPGDEEDDLATHPKVGLSGPSSQAFGTESDQGRLLQHPPNPSATWLPAWPTTEPWELETPLNAALSPDRADAVLYGLRGSEDVLIRDRVSASQSEPTTTFSVTAHPTVGTLPDLMFPGD